MDEGQIWLAMTKGDSIECIAKELQESPPNNADFPSDLQIQSPPTEKVGLAARTSPHEQQRIFLQLVGYFDALRKTTIMLYEAAIKKTIRLYEAAINIRIRKEAMEKRAINIRIQKEAMEKSIQKEAMEKRMAKLEAGVSNHHRATIANLKAQVMNSQAEIAKLREELHMSELYNASSTTPYLCAVSLIKYIEEFVLEAARKVVREFLSNHSLTRQEKSALLKAAKSSTFQVFRNQIQNMESVWMKETILSSVQQKFLEGIEGVGNTHNNLDLVLEFEEFWYFWELCNLGRAELFDWDLCQGKQIDPEMRLSRARIRVKFLKDIEGRLLDDSPHFFWDGFKTILAIAINKKRKELFDVLGI